MDEVREQNEVYIQSDKALQYKIVTFGRIIKIIFYYESYCKT